MNTVITKNNEVRVYDPEYAVLAISDIGDCIAITDSGEIIVNQGNPITWPTDASDGLQAIVDVKAGTLRFAYDGWPRAATEFVVSEYVEPVVSVEDSAPVHVLDTIEYWPSSNPTLASFRPAPQLPSGFTWIPQPIHWILGVVGSPKTYTRDDWESHRSPVKPVPPQVTAASMLTAALGHMEDRAKTYDAPGGERSMGKTVAAFNIITGLELTEEQGWLFMEILKQVRSQQGDYRADNYEDMVAYAALRGECAARERGNKS